MILSLGAVTAGASASLSASAWALGLPSVLALAAYGAAALMNERFHSVIGEMADNEFLMPSLRRLLIDHTRIGMTFYDPRKLHLAEERALAADQHDQFIDLIEAHKWFNLAALYGDERAAEWRAEIAEDMTAREIVEAQKAARAIIQMSQARAA